jgi:aerobic carbon-monoxide dehydrogenase small subunit
VTVREITVTVNGRSYRRAAEGRRLLSDFLREDCGLTGTHVGCEHGVCGACTVLCDGQAIRSCLMFAVQADGAEIITIEGLAPGGEPLGPVQRGFMECHGLQCGFCTPGFVISATAFLDRCPDPTEEEVREGMSGNVCRCTGYQGIVRAILRAAQLRQESGAGL